jgi:hypothetical protein
MLRTPRMRLVALALACVAGAGAAAEQPADPGPRDGPLLGFLLDPDQAIGLPPVPEEAEGRAPIVRLEARWDEIEHLPGTFDWTGIAPAVDALHGAGFRTVLTLTGSHPHYLPEGGPPSPLADVSLEAWLEFVRSATRTFAGRVTVFELGGIRPGVSDDDANIQALVLKQSALTVRAEAQGRGAEVLIAQGALPVAALEWQRALWDRELAAYVDILPLIVDVADDLGEGTSGVRSVFEESLKHPPASTLWAYVRGGSGWDAAGLAVATLTSGASAALFRPADPEQARWASGLQRKLDEGYAPAALGRLRLDYDEERAPERARVLGRFFNGQDFTTLVVYHAPGGDGEAAEARLVVDASSVRNVRVLDPLTARTRRVRNTPAPEGPGRALHVGTAPAPRAALFNKQIVTPGFELPAEELEVASQRGLTAEEIIARFQLLQQDQDDRLERWMAKGRIDFHFKLAQGTSTVDVSIDSNYFWERDGHLEWEQTGYYINGNKVRWKNIPELPLIQPEKVITLPLDLTLDKTYTYRLAGDERVAGRDAYVIAFEPSVADPELSLYRGRIWIDKQSFARVKASVIQNNLEPPVLANEEIDRFELRTGADGQPYWMFSSIDGQQVWKAAGRNFVVRRELTFSDYEINPPRGEFEQRRAAAYASHNQMLQDTDQGFRYLERQADGTRTVKMKQDTSQIFAAAGAFKDDSQDNVVPLAGVNYFNYNLWGKDIQFNALFAGVLGFVTASKPTLGGTRMDLSVDAGLNALKFDDKVYEGDDEIEAERIESRGQTLALRLGVPAGQFVKFNFIGGVAFRQYFDSDDGEDAIEDYNLANPEILEFVLPEDHLQVTGTAEVEFNRRGYNLTGAYSRASRSDWEPWGLYDSVTGEYGTLVDGVFVPTGGEPVEDAFMRWRVSAAKEWYLPKFQKIRGAVDYLNGSDLDRFSRYEFSFFGDGRLNGFSGSGVRFDEGVIGRIGYAFNLFEVIRLDAALDSARIEQDDSADGEQSFTGIGLSGNFVGPWKTVVNVSYGYALSSDISDLEGQQEFLVLVLKLF